MATSPSKRTHLRVLNDRDAQAAYEEHLQNQYTNEERRVRRKRYVRARTVNIQRLSKAEWHRMQAEYPEDTHALRPKTRGECANGPRPCPFVSCRHHLYLDVSAKTGSIKFNFPDLEVWEMKESCALDVAERIDNQLATDKLAERLNITRERVRQKLEVILAQLAFDTCVLTEWKDAG